MTNSGNAPQGDRLAKVIARAGLASRRDAEQMILDLRVSVDGRTISTPAFNVSPGAKVVVDGKPLPAAEATRVWLYHKPAGLVTTERDEKDRETIFDALREQLGRVLSVGRLDLTSEGLLLLTNDGALKRQLELPQTGWLRRYRVRVNGKPDEAALQRLRDGIEVDGEKFQGMQVTFDRQQGANAWLTIGLREGRNREIRRAAEAVGLYVNRLIRVSYGPFQLGKLTPGEVEEIKPKVLRDQLGGVFEGTFADSRRETVEEVKRPASPRGKDRERPFKSGPSRDEKRAPKGDFGRRSERSEQGSDKKTKSQRKAEMRADTSVSLRKGGQRGRGISKAKPKGGKTFQRPPRKSD